MKQFTDKEVRRMIFQAMRNSIEDISLDMHEENDHEGQEIYRKQVKRVVNRIIQWSKLELGWHK